MTIPSVLQKRLDRIIDPQKVFDGRYIPAGIHVVGTRARCSARLCRKILRVNAALGGANPYPWGLYFVDGDPEGLAAADPLILAGRFLEVFPCDREDPRAIKLNWSDTGARAEFGFAPVAAAFGITQPQGARLFIPAFQFTDLDEGLPLIVLALHLVQRQSVANQPGGAEFPADDAAEAFDQAAAARQEPVS